MNISYRINHMSHLNTHEAIKEKNLHYNEVVVRDDYKLNYLASNIPELNWFIDLGANIGYTTLMARMLFQDANILSLEPCKTTFSFLNKNVEGFNYVAPLGDGILASRDIYLLNEAYGPEGEITLSTNGKNLGWGYVVEGKGIKRHPLRYYFAKYNIAGTYGIKCDTEGAEQYLVDEWDIVAKSEFICLELHWGKTYDDEPRKDMEWQIKNIVQPLEKTHQTIFKEFNGYVGNLVASRRK